MYNIEHYDNTVPSDIHQAAYDYCQQQRWYTTLLNMPSVDINPANGEFKRELDPYVGDVSVYRTSFGADAEGLSNHSPILNLFNHINETLFDGKFIVDGRHEGSASLQLSKSDTEWGSGMKVNVPFYTGDEDEAWKLDVIKNGSRAYMQAQPYDPSKRAKSIHRDWGGWQLDHNKGGHYTLLFVSNLIWNPEWLSEIVYYEDSDSGIGWPAKIMPNVPGRVILHDGRCLHATRSTAIEAPELSQHIGFRVRLKGDDTYGSGGL